MGNLGFMDTINEVSKDIKSPEQMLGKGLNQPFNGANSGPRKIMYSVHSDQTFPLMKGETPIVSTGYEIRYGDYSSSITRADVNYRVVGKISKYSFAPNHHYWLILEDATNKKLEVVERIAYHYITEQYGYLYNNSYMDSLSPGDYIPTGKIVQKSLAFDEYNNRKDGVNMNVVYMALDDNMEDSIRISDVAAAKLASPLIKPVEIMINDNDIPLNIYGDDKVYKIFPDIGEKIKNANLIALRKEKNEESFYSQSVHQLTNIMMSDDLKQVHGRVIDVDVYCNKPEILDNHYYGQIKMYYQELQRRSSEIIQTVIPYKSAGYELDYELDKLFTISKRISNGDLYMDKKVFSNIKLKITVIEEIPMNPGDKASNRFGGKGIISDICPQQLMPRFKNKYGEYEYIDFIFNSSTMYNRENIGQCFELSLTHIGTEIINKIYKENLDLNTSFNLIKKFISLCSEEQANYLEKCKEDMSTEELASYIYSIIQDGSIFLSLKPISEAMTIDKLRNIYKEFPWINRNQIEVVLIDSEGKPRYVKSRKPVVVGRQYILRLKQFAEEKFSATSLSATNIRNENTKSRAKKDYRELYPNTPIRFGNMETSQMNHLGVDTVISNLMIHSVSPQGRRLVEQMYTGDPFKIDIKLNSDAKNRSAEITQTYLKTIGRRLVFKKRLKVAKKTAIPVISFIDGNSLKAISFISENEGREINGKYVVSPISFVDDKQKKN